MAQNANNIHVGPGRMFLGVVQPATGTPPTRLAHTDGVPDSFVSGTDVENEVGHTEGDATFTYQLVKGELVSEQALAPVGVYAESEMCQLQFNCQERIYQALLTVFDNIGTARVDATSSVIGHDTFYGGGGASVLNPKTQCVVLTSRQRTNTDLFEVLTMYKAYSVEGFVVAYSRATPSMYAVTLKGLSDDLREDGDRLFSWDRELPTT